MPSSVLHALVDDTRLRPLLPLLHTAWADGSLTPEEIAHLRSAFSAAVDDECVPTLEAWLDPDNPPSSLDLARLAATLRTELPDETLRLGPVEMGLRLAGAVPGSVAEALRKVERDVGPFAPPAAATVTAHPAGSTLDALPVPERAAFDRSELKKLLDGPHGVVKREVREILSRPEFAYRHGLDIAQYRRQVGEWVSILADEGVGALGYPETVGGRGDPGGFLAAFATIAHHDLSLLTKFGVQFGLFAGAVMRLGTERHRPLLARAITGEEPGCFAMTETGHGSNVAALETRASFDPQSDEFVLDTPVARARKDYIGNAARDGRTAVVFARLIAQDLDHGVHAFVVPIRLRDGRIAPGVTAVDNGAKAGLNGVDNGWLTFDQVRISRDALLDRFATVERDGTYRSEIRSPSRRFFTTLGTLVGGRLSVASGAVSVAETALTIAIRYAHRRRQFASNGGTEMRLIDYRTHQRRLIPRLAATYAYHFAAADLAARYAELEAAPGDVGVDRRVFEGRVAGLKAFATWHALATVAECRQACGGQGYMSENRLGPMAADVDVFTTYEGDNTVLAQLLAKALLTDYRSSFDEFTPGRLVRYVVDRVAGFVADSVPLVGAVGGDLDDPETCRQLLARRVRQLLETLAARVKARIDGGMDASAAFLDVQPHAVALARAATESDVLESFLRVEASDADLAEVLDHLAVLFALWRVEEDMAGYLSAGLVTSNGASHIRSLVTSLAGTLADHSRHLVDSFGIPNQVVGAPIAL